MSKRKPFAIRVMKPRGPRQKRWFCKRCSRQVMARRCPGCGRVE